eukprot:COSAG02_NODE_17_length_55377_cov_106.402258_6_plen_403_part_00
MWKASEVSAALLLGIFALLCTPHGATALYCDPTCQDDCSGCTAEQVVGAMARRPDDSHVQGYGCDALAFLAEYGVEYGGAEVFSAEEVVRAGGVARVAAAMARFPDDSWVQPNCQAASAHLPDPCHGVSCGGHGSCAAASGTCACEPGYSGPHCETRDLCHGVSCGGHGSCAAGSGSCACEPGYSGPHCTLPVGISVGMILALLIVTGGIVGACVHARKARHQSSLAVPLGRSDDGSAVSAERRPSLLVVAAELVSRLSASTSAVLAAAPAEACVGRTLASVLDATGLVDFADALAEAGCVDADDIAGMPDAELAELGMKPVQIRRLRRVLIRQQPEGTRVQRIKFMLSCSTRATGGILRRAQTILECPLELTPKRPYRKLVSSAADMDLLLKKDGGQGLSH